MRRSSRLQADRSHGPPEKRRGRKVCSRCGRPYRFRSKTGLWTREPYGPCPGMKQTGELSRSPLRSVSPDRERKRGHRGLDTPLKEYVLGLPCILADNPAHTCRGDVVAHHVRHKNHAGDWTERGGKRVGNLLPTCDFVHEYIHKHGKETAAEMWGFESLAAEARRIGRAYREGEA